MTRQEAAKLVAVMLAAFPNSRATTGTSEVYERMLADLDYPTANAAVERLLATSKFMPSIAELREACLDLSVGERKAGGEAWGELLSAIGRYGSYREPGKDFTFQDPVIGRCVAALGWQEICLSENQVADRARFIELYDQLAQGERKNLNAGALPAAQRLKALSSATPLLAADVGTAADAMVSSLAKKLAGAK